MSKLLSKNATLLEKDKNATLFFRVPAKIQKFVTKPGDHKISAIVTTFGNIDSMGDIIEAGAFDEWLEEFNETDKGLQMLYQHQRGNIIGAWESFEANDTEMRGDGILYPEIAQAEDTMALLERGMITGVSIGASATNYSIRYSDEGGFEGITFHQMRLREVSIVDMPANEQTEILSVTQADGSIDVRSFEKLLKTHGLSRKQSKAVISAAKDALNSTADDDDDDEYDIAAIKSALKQDDNNDIDIAKIKSLLKV